MQWYEVKPFYIFKQKFTAKTFIFQIDVSAQDEILKSIFTTKSLYSIDHINYSWSLLHVPRRCKSTQRFMIWLIVIFLIVLVTKFLTKVAPIFRDFLGYFEKHYLEVKIAVDILGKFWKIWSRFYFNIWSHW